MDNQFLITTVKIIENNTLLIANINFINIVSINRTQDDTGKRGPNASPLVSEGVGIAWYK